MHMGGFWRASLPRLTSASQQDHERKMNIYSLYTQSGNRAGFWIQHRKWQNKCAQVHSIGGVSSGPLPGHAPTYGAAPVAVSCFDVRSGRLVGSSPAIEQPDDRGYVLIAQPPWHKRSTDHRVLTTS
jgi:hypothetical protein